MSQEDRRTIRRWSGMYGLHCLELCLSPTQLAGLVARLECMTGSSEYGRGCDRDRQNQPTDAGREV